MRNLKKKNCKFFFIRDELLGKLLKGTFFKVFNLGVKCKKYVKILMSYGEK